MIEAILAVSIAVLAGVFVMYFGWPDAMHNLFWRTRFEARVVSDDDGHANCINKVWSDDTIDTLGFIEAMMILVEPHYPHQWRRFFNWWHRNVCYPCAEARVKWPETKRRFLNALAPFKRDLPEFPKEEARAWVEEEIRHHPAVTFKPVIVEAALAAVAGLNVGFYRTPREAAMQFKPIEERERIAAASAHCKAWPHHFCLRGDEPCSVNHLTVQCCRCGQVGCRRLVNHVVEFEDWED